MEENIILDKSSFKALAVDTRVDILKTLGQRRHTQSELAADLGLSVPTIKQHLDALEKAGLVLRNEEGRKWVYYSLTKKGKAIVNPEEKKFWIALAVFVLTVGSAASAVVRQKFGTLYAGTAQFSAVSAEMKAAPLAADAATEGARAVTTAPPTAIPWGWIILGTIVLVEVVVVSYFWWRTREQRRLLGADLSKNARI
ncbi:MAG: winged helix-turn-helix domain-containing protein [Nanoarchaeota archaeon]